MTLELNKLKEVAEAATQGTWKWWTSNSKSRLSVEYGANSRDGGVINAIDHNKSAYLMVKECDQKFIEIFQPSVVKQLIAMIEELDKEKSNG